MSLRRALGLALIASLGVCGNTLTAARDPAPGFSEHSLDLPGMPAAVIPADLDADGRRDLVVLVAYTAWGQTAETEQVSFDDIEGLVEVMSVVSALVDRRELRVYRALDGGSGYEARPVVLDLDTSLHALQAGAAAEPLLAITDEGISAVRLVGEGARAELSLVPLLETETVLTGSGSFYADLEFLRDLDGDARLDLVLPTAEGWSVFAAAADGFEAEPRARVAGAVAAGEDLADSDSDSDSDSERVRGAKRRAPRQPEIVDVNDDGRDDLLVLRPGEEPFVALQLADLAFSAPFEIGLSGRGPADEIVFVGALDRSAPTAVVSQTQIELPEEAGWRLEVQDAKRPTFEYRRYSLEPDLDVGPLLGPPFRAIGYTFEGSDHDDEEEGVVLPGGFQDLDGDGRLDLVAITLDFSILPMVTRLLVTRRIALTMDFHPWCQRRDGSFREVPNLDLSGRFKIDLRNIQIKHLSQFAGDFDGDGRADFVQLGRGRKVTIHEGRPGCEYPSQPSRTIRLAKEPRHLGLVRILDVDGDRRSDLYVVHPLKDPKSGASIPARVDLYLSEPG